MKQTLNIYRNDEVADYTVDEVKAKDASWAVQDAIDQYNLGNISKVELEKHYILPPTLDTTRPSADRMFNAHVKQIRATITDWLTKLGADHTVRKAA